MYNVTLSDYADSVQKLANRPSDVVVVASQIFDVLKGFMGNYRSNLPKLRDLMKTFRGRTMWRLGDALHDKILSKNWDYSQFPGRYMNGPRMEAANVFGAQLMKDAGFQVLDTFSTTAGRIEKSHDGNHYWRQPVRSDRKIGNSVSNTNTQIMLNLMCNPEP